MNIYFDRKGSEAFLILADDSGNRFLAIYSK